MTKQITIFCIVFVASREGAVEFLQRHRNVPPGTYNEHRLLERPIPMRAVQIVDDAHSESDDSLDEMLDEDLQMMQFEEIIIPDANSIEAHITITHLIEATRRHQQLFKTIQTNRMKSGFRKNYQR